MKPSPGPLRSLAAFALALMLLPGPAASNPSPLPLPEPVASRLQDPRLSGSGLFRYWGFAIYDARLWIGRTPPDFADLSRSPLALELTYRRDFSGTDIAQSSLDELESLGHGALARTRDWLGRMRTLFPDVRENDRLLGVIDSRGHTHLYHNDRPVGSMQDREFSHAFFSIWLSPDSSAPELREALLRALAAPDRAEVR